VMVCPAFAAREAQARGVAVAGEIELLIVHGVLHLLNYDHHEPSEEAVMQARQNDLLASFRAGATPAPPPSREARG